MREEKDSNKISLQDAMSAVAHSLSAEAPRPAPVTPEKPLSELEAFVALDPLLADLHKQFLDARATHKLSLSEYGRRDAMTDMAELAMDSAWCAMQTRYMELRADRTMMKSAQDMMRARERLLEEETSKKREKESLEFLTRLRIFNLMQKEMEEKSSSAIVWAFIYILMNDNHNNGFFGHRYQPTYSFNRIAA